MHILLISLWKPGKGGIVTHVENLLKHSKNEFTIQGYPRSINLPLLRAFSMVVVGFFSQLGTRCDIIHAHYALPQGFLGVLLKKVKGCPLVLTVHGSDMTVLTKNPITRPFVKFVLSRADMVIAVSEFLKKEVIKLGIDEDKVRVIYGGANSQSDRPENFEIKGRVIAFVGSLVRQKGVDVLIEAFKDVPDSKLVIIGEGKEMPALERLAHDIDHVYFMGYKENLYSIFEKTSVLVLPSRKEGFGLVLLEAMNAGVPVVATNVGGINEIVEDGRNGILVEPENPEQLARGILNVLDDEELREELIRNGRETAAKFTWENMSNAVEEIYEEFG